MNERGAARNWVIAYVLIAAVGLGGLLLIGNLVGANSLPGEPQSKPTSTDGRTIFVQANCAGCHGIDGTGTRGPSLVSGAAATLTLDEIIARVNNGKRLAGMPKFEGFLTPEQIRAVAEYVVSLREAS
ncbi:MAG TPA: cytochrome c [Actinomycetota bacterium]|nr:cytochrome c [Actinomycetota bacterium]